jgi:hypothetical protein
MTTRDLSLCPTRRYMGRFSSCGIGGAALVLEEFRERCELICVFVWRAPRCRRGLVRVATPWAREHGLPDRIERPSDIAACPPLMKRVIVDCSDELVRPAGEAVGDHGCRHWT